MKETPFTKRDAQSLSITRIGKVGFTLWIKEPNGGVEHWLIDGSCVGEDFEIRIGKECNYKFIASYDKKENLIRIKKRV